MDDSRSIEAPAPAMERSVRLSVWAAALTPLFLLGGLSSARGFAFASADGFSVQVVSCDSVHWLSDAPFQSPTLNEVEEAAERAAAPHPVQAEDVLTPRCVAVRRMRIGGLYGP